MIFILVLQIFYAGLAFVECGEMVPVPVHPRTYAHAYYAYARSICDRDRARRTGNPNRGRHLINGKMALYYTEIAAKTWISLSKGTKLLLYRKDHARSKLRAFHVKIIVCRPLNLAVGRLLKKKKKKKKKKKMEKIAVWPISV